MDNIRIAQASVEELNILQTIGQQTFVETFASSNSPNDMTKYLEENFSETKLKAELSNPNSFFYIAFDDDTPIGYLKVNVGDAQTEIPGDDTLEIERIYVKSSHHGKSVGQLLYDKALDVSRDLQKSSIWLGVWEENPRAIRFYEKNGFVAFDKHIFKMGNDEQTDIMMKKVVSSH